jgi:methylase of polypeptide subunit release factors
VSEFKTIELMRQSIQSHLDAHKTQIERNKLGQFATPTRLAIDMLKYAETLLPADLKIRFLDPAFGTGSFYSALLQTFSHSRIAETVGYEIDPTYGNKAIELWRDTPLKLNLSDFTIATPPSPEEAKANLLICNPPYVRHHHLSQDEKLRLQGLTQQVTGARLSGLTGLYCYFLCLSYGWMAENGIAGWLIPSEFMDVNYGQEVKKFLLSHVTLLRIHRFDPKDMQFGDALVSSAVVWFKKAVPAANQPVEFTEGGTLMEPKLAMCISVDVLRHASKWTRFFRGFSSTVRLTSPPTRLLGGEGSNALPFPCREGGGMGALGSPSTQSEKKQFKLSDLFTIKRGLATGANQFFILTPEQVFDYQIPVELLKPILPSPRYLSVDEIEADSLGNPILDRQLFLLACDFPEDKVKTAYPFLWKYLQWGVNSGVSQRYLCRHRSPWYSQEKRPASRFLCTYMGREGTKSGSLFRFILNHSQATAANVYLMLYPKLTLEKVLKANPEIVKVVWQALNRISAEILKGEGRVYGGGLHKLEPSELGNIPADNLLAVLPALSE